MMFVEPCADPEHVTKGVLKTLLSPLFISLSALRATLEMQLDPRGPIASAVGFMPVFLRKHISNCDFSGGSGLDTLPHLNPPIFNEMPFAGQKNSLFLSLSKMGLYFEVFLFFFTNQLFLLPFGPKSAS